MNGFRLTRTVRSGFQNHESLQRKWRESLAPKPAKLHFLVATPLFKPNPSSPQFLNLSFCKYPFLNRSFSKAITMAQPDLQNHSPEIKEPSLKIQKLGQNGVAAEISRDPISLLRVKKLSEKAVLPCRASPLSAGYDLSRYIYTHIIHNIFNFSSSKKRKKKKLFVGFLWLVQCNGD